MSRATAEEAQIVEGIRGQVTAYEDAVILKTLPPKGPAELPEDVRPSEGIPAGDNGTQYLGEDFHLTEMGQKAVFAYGLDVDNLERVMEPIQLVRGSGDGSRHTIQPNDKLFRVPMRNNFPLVSAFFILAPGGRYVKTHPQHETVSSDVPGWYVERFQRAPAPHGEQASRTADRVQVDTSVLPEQVFQRID